MLIAVEGIDGSGKTTVGKAIAQRLQFGFLEKVLQSTSGLSLSEYIKLREGLKQNTIAKDQIMSMFFGMNNLICGTLGKTQNVVADRYIATNYYWYGCAETEPLFDTLIRLSGKPQLTVLLDISHETMQKRIEDRNYNSQSEKDRELALIPHVDLFSTKVTEFLNRYSFNYMIIKNDNRHISDIVDEVISNIDFQN